MNLLTHQLPSLRVSKALRDAYVKLAQQEGRKLSDTLRRHLEATLPKAKRTP